MKENNIKKDNVSNKKLGLMIYEGATREEIQRYIGDIVVIDYLNKLLIVKVGFGEYYYMKEIDESRKYKKIKITEKQ